MRIVIIGTSNGIFNDGYQKSIKLALPDSSIENRSLGASPADFLTFRLAGARTHPNDNFIIETLVNDAACLRAGGYTIERLKEALHSAISNIFTLGGTPIPVLIPGLLRDKYTEAAIAAHREVYEQHDLNTFDAFNWLMERSNYVDSAYEDFFDDPAHLSREILQEIGEQIIPLLKNECSAHPIRNKKSQLIYEPVKLGKNLFLSDQLSASSGRLKNSIMDCEFLNIESENIRIKVSEFKTIYSFVLNSARSNSIAEFHCGESFAKDFRFNAHHSSSPDRIIVTPIIQNIKPVESEYVEISLQSKSLLRCEGTHYANAAECFSPSLSIVGIIYKVVGGQFHEKFSC